MTEQETWLFVGLGNPGPKYVDTWHNCGFMAVDRLSERHRIPIDRIKFQSLYGQGHIAGHKVILQKPTTFMNLSGEAVRATADFFKIPNEQIVVFYDDIDIHKGLVRIREKGGPGTHNGMRSLVQHLGGGDFPRMRIGIGPQPRQWDIVDYVLSTVQAADRELLDEALENACDGAELLLKRDLQFAMNRINMRKPAALVEAEKQRKALAKKKKEMQRAKLQEVTEGLQDSQGSEGLEISQSSQDSQDLQGLQEAPLSEESET